MHVSFDKHYTTGGRITVLNNLHTVNQLNLTALKISFLKIEIYLVQENLAFSKGVKI